MRCIAPAMHLIFLHVSAFLYSQGIFADIKTNQIILLLIYRNDKLKTNTIMKKYAINILVILIPTHAIYIVCKWMPCQ